MEEALDAFLMSGGVLDTDALKKKMEAAESTSTSAAADSSAASEALTKLKAELPALEEAVLAAKTELSALSSGTPEADAAEVKLAEGREGEAGQHLPSGRGGTHESGAAQRRCGGGAALRGGCDHELQRGGGRSRPVIPARSSNTRPTHGPTAVNVYGGPTRQPPTSHHRVP